MKYSKFFPWNNKIWDKNLSMISWAYLLVNGEHIKDAKDSSNFYLNCKMMQHVEQSIPRLDLTFLTSSRIYCLLSPIVCAELAIFFLSLLTCNQEQSCQSIIFESFVCNLYCLVVPSGYLLRFYSTNVGFLYLARLLISYT